MARQGRPQSPFLGTLCARKVLQGFFLEKYKDAKQCELKAFKRRRVFSFFFPSELFVKISRISIFLEKILFFVQRIFPLKAVCLTFCSPQILHSFMKTFSDLFSSCPLFQSRYILFSKARTSCGIEKPFFCQL